MGLATEASTTMSSPAEAYFTLLGYGVILQRSKGTSKVNIILHRRLEHYVLNVFSELLICNLYS